MALAMGVLRRNSRYHLRMRVPKALLDRGLIQRSEYTEALGTADPHEAKRLGRQREAQKRAEWEALLRGDRVLTSEAIEAELERLYAERQARDDAEQASGREPYAMDPQPGADDETTSRAERGLEWALDEIADAIQRDDFDMVRKEARAIVQRLGVVTGEGTPAWRELCLGLLSMEGERLSVRKAHAGGDFHAEPRRPFTPALAKRRAAARSSFRPADDHRPDRTHARAVGGRLSTEAAAYIEAEHRASRWRQRTEDQIKSVLGWLARHLGDPIWSTISPADVADFKLTLERLPTTYGKRKGDQTLSLREAADAAAVAGQATLQRKTVKRHINHLAGFFDWAAIKYGLKRSHDNPARGFKFPGMKRARTQRPEWPADKLNALFSSPLYAGCQPKRRSQPGPDVIRDALYWTPLIGLLAGLRLEEAAGLMVPDVRLEEGTWILDVRPNTIRPHLKSERATRPVPIHPALIELGFVEWVKALPTDGPLFRELRPGGREKRLGFYLSKDFTRYRKAIGIYEERIDLHALRHNFTTALINTGASTPIADDLTGHEGGDGGETKKRYYKGAWLITATDAIKRVYFPGVTLPRLPQMGREAAA